MTAKRTGVFATVTCALLAAWMGSGVACGAEGLDAGGVNGDGVGGAGSNGGAGGALAPEQELETSFRAPVATGRYVWVANPASGRVAYIDAQTLKIELVDAGHGPRQLAAVPDPADDVAIVLNELSFDATLMRARQDGSLSVESLAVPSGGNRWAVSPDGRWATAWTDGRQLDADPFDGLQDITVLDLHNQISTSLTVGYRPVELGYDAAAARLFAITQDGISVIELDGASPSVIRNVALSDEPLADTSTRDVAITPDGQHALVRLDGAMQIDVLSLRDEEHTTVALPVPATDLDLSAAGDMAVAVLRDSGQLMRLPMPASATDPTAATIVDVPGVVIGSVALAASSSLAFLYTNATPSSTLTVVDIDEGVPEPTYIALHAPVQAVLPTDDAAHAVVLHGAPDDSSAYAAALSLVPIGAQLPSKIVGLDQPVASVAIDPSGDRVVLATGTEASETFGMLIAKLPSLAITQHDLASRPIAAGIVAAARRGFIAQEHADGRISFVDLDTDSVRTLTGFELATRVVDGGTP